MRFSIIYIFVLLILLMVINVNAETETDSAQTYEWYFVGTGHSNSSYLTDKCDLRDAIIRKELPPQIVYVDDALDLTNNKVIGSIVRSANLRFQNLCASKKVKPRYLNLNVWISNSSGRKNWKFRARHKQDWVFCKTKSYQPKNVCDGTYRNGFAIKKIKLEKQRKKDEARLARKSAAKERRAREEAQKLRVEKAAANKSQALADRFQAIWIPWDKVSVNPFAFEGEVFLLKTKFQRMLAADTASFGKDFGGISTVMIAVPRTAFIEKKEVVVVGRIIDSDPATNPPGISGNIIRMKYLGHEFCSLRNCSDFGALRTKGL